MYIYMYIYVYICIYIYILLILNNDTKPVKNTWRTKLVTRSFRTNGSESG